MTDKSMFGNVRNGVLALVIPLFFIAGCGTTAEYQQANPIVAAVEPSLATKVEQKQSDGASLAEQRSGVVDEKHCIYFSLGSSSISAQEKYKLQDIAAEIKSDRAMRVTLIGYSNDNGSSSFNLAVADARVESVSAVLKNWGQTASDQKNVIGGEKSPGAKRSAEYRRKMRRVELVVSSKR
ncbi:MAG: OmpA family protein [Dechloromonas sp.]|nr:MAG: OmpA family protein [Dechloromonas sp.]